MESEDVDAFAEQIREAVFDCLLAELLAERMADMEGEIEIALPIDHFFAMHDDDLE